jgi:hypothetical protein
MPKNGTVESSNSEHIKTVINCKQNILHATGSKLQHFRASCLPEVFFQNYAKKNDRKKSFKRKYSQHQKLFCPPSLNELNQS